MHKRKNKWKKREKHLLIRYATVKGEKEDEERKEEKEKRKPESK